MAWEPTTRTESKMFRPLTDEVEEEFRQFARNNDPEMEQWDYYHPVCREEWERRGIHRAST